MGEVPRVRNDILRQFPFLNEYYDRRLAPEDNVSIAFDGSSVDGTPADGLQPF